MNEEAGNIRGFAPLLDTILQQYGLYTAAVYGEIWRYCQMRNSVCYASVQTIADKLNISYQTAFTHLKELVDAGYIEDLTPEYTNRPHNYRVTGKAGIRTVSESYDEIYDVKECSLADREHSPLDREHSLADGDKDTIKETNKETTERRAQKNLQEDRDAYLQKIENHKQQTRESLAKSAKHNLTDGLENYPEDIRDTLDVVCKLWNFRPPRGRNPAKNKSMADWIKSGQELSDACGEFGVNVLENIREDFEKYMHSHNGLAPYTVSSPRSLVNMARGKAAEMRTPKEHNMPNMEIYYGNGKKYVPGLGVVDVEL